MEGIGTHSEGIRTHFEGIRTHLEGIRTHSEGIRTHFEGIGSHLEAIRSHFYRIRKVCWFFKIHRKNHNCLIINLSLQKNQQTISNSCPSTKNQLGIRNGKSGIKIINQKKNYYPKGII